MQESKSCDCEVVQICVVFVTIVMVIPMSPS